MTSLYPLLEDFGVWAAHDPGESFVIRDGVLEINWIEGERMYAIRVPEAQFEIYLLDSKPGSRNEMAGNKWGNYWADLSRRISSAISRDGNWSSTFEFNGASQLFEPRSLGAAPQSRPGGDAPPGLRVVQRPPN